MFIFETCVIFAFRNKNKENAGHPIIIIHVAHLLINNNDIVVSKRVTKFLHETLGRHYRVLRKYARFIDLRSDCFTTRPGLRSLTTKRALFSSWTPS